MKTKPLRTFTINRRLWHRGKRKYPSALLVPQTGRMCCLGQIACQLGYSKEEISSIGGPNALRDCSKFDAIGLTHFGLCYLDSMMNINDNPDLTDDEREAKLIALALGHFHLVFEN